MQSLRNKPIGVFDSGFGGLTVLKELQKELPHERFIYLGDTARLPYGTKSPDAIIRYTLECCSFLVEQGVKLIVIACNTATSAALDTIAAQFSIPIIGVIDPVIDTVTSGNVGILGTRATIQSGVYQTKIQHKIPSAKVTQVASPLLVSLVEEGFIDHPMTQLAIREYIRPLHDASVDTVILACTHFPLLKSQIERELGPTIQVIDPAFATAVAVKRTLSNLHLLSDQNSSQPLFYVTDDPEKFTRLGQAISNVSLSNTQEIKFISQRFTE